MKELINIVNSKLQAVIDELKSQKDTLEAKVKTVVESMTGLKVVDINIHVQGLNISKDNKKEEDIEKNEGNVNEE